MTITIHELEMDDDEARLARAIHMFNLVEELIQQSFNDPDCPEDEAALATFIAAGILNDPRLTIDVV